MSLVYPLYPRIVYGELARLTIGTACGGLLGDNGIAHLCQHLRRDSPLHPLAHLGGWHHHMFYRVMMRALLPGLPVGAIVISAIRVMAMIPKCGTIFCYGVKSHPYIPSLLLIRYIIRTGP